jgi:predicted nucleic acid-binding protein
MALAPALPDTRLVLDTCTLTDWRYQRLATRQRIIDYTGEHGEAPALTSVTVFEALHGFEKKSPESRGLTERDSADRRATQLLIEQAAEIVPFDSRAAGIAAYIFPRLSQSQRNRHWCDLFIAATAMAHGYGVATSDQADFELIGATLSNNHPVPYLAIWKA